MGLLCESCSGIGIPQACLEVPLCGSKSMCAEFIHQLAQWDAVSEDAIDEFRIVHTNIS